MKTNKKPRTSKAEVARLAKNIRRKTRQSYSAEEKIRIVLAGPHGEESISVLCVVKASQKIINTAGQGISGGREALLVQLHSASCIVTGGKGATFGFYGLE